VQKNRHVSLFFLSSRVLDIDLFGIITGGFRDLHKAPLMNQSGIMNTQSRELCGVSPPCKIYSQPLAEGSWDKTASFRTHLTRFTLGPYSGIHSSSLLKVEADLPPKLQLLQDYTEPHPRRQPASYIQLPTWECQTSPSQFKFQLWLRGLTEVFVNSRIIIFVPLYLLTHLKKNSEAWVRERTIPTSRPPFVGEVSANFYGQRDVA
jgi:hypothetical protein